MSYTTLDAVRRYLRIPASDSAQDAAILALIPAIDAGIDRYCRRTLSAHSATVLHDAPANPLRLWLQDWLLSVTSITNGNGAALTFGTQVFGGPSLGPPYRWLDINTSSGVLFQAGATTQRCISVVGVWGIAASALPIVTLAANTWIDAVLNRAGRVGVATERVEEFSVTFEDSEALPPAHVRALLDSYKWREYS
jgi:hypothetical protein